MVSKISQRLFFRDLISICLDGYIELLISGFLNLGLLNVVESKLLGDIISYYIAILSLLLTLVLVPLIALYVLLQPLETLANPDFARKWSGFYENIKLKSKLHLLFYPIYCLRRLVFVLLCINLAEYPSI